MGEDRGRIQGFRHRKCQSGEWRFRSIQTYGLDKLVFFRCGRGKNGEGMAFGLMQKATTENGGA